MTDAVSYVNEIQKRYPAPENPNVKFGLKEIQAFENAIGIELPSDYYEFLQTYGYGSFNDYFYIWNPFHEKGTEFFLQENNQERENYEDLERNLLGFTYNEQIPYIDCKFTEGELVVVDGNQRLAEFLRVEKIDVRTRSKILALGDHYPYAFYPEEGGLISFGRTDDDSFFMRRCGKKTTIVMYSDKYYEFDMTVTEFILEYLTKTLKLPMMNDEDEWEFVAYEMEISVNS